MKTRIRSAAPLSPPNVGAAASPIRLHFERERERERERETDVPRADRHER